MKVVVISILFLYALSLTFILIYSFIQLHLTYAYRKSRKKNKTNGVPKAVPENELPVATVQLPLYNELYVTERLLEKISEFDYPSEKLEIQVLDDSTDESFAIAEAKCKEIAARGIDIKHIRRPERTGYKAGALQYGLDRSRGEFVAIFDADFLPESDFLKKTIPSFQDKNVGMVQTRWGHINEDYSIFTKALAFHLNAHFSVEQSGRNSRGYFMNFNGTAGVWRKKAIYDGGGWEADTLTEDLDLSYRTQMKGWKFLFLEDVVAPAELPAVMSAIKSQQYRWTKGGAETARKHVKNLLSSKISWSKKFHGIAHLLNSTIFIFVLLTAILSFPAIMIKNVYPEWKPLFIAGSSFLVAFLILIFFYVNSLEIRNKSKWKNFVYFMTMFPTFLCFSMGLSLHNSIAVIKGLVGKRSPFIRTPKFDIKSISDSWKNNKYLKQKIELTTIAEGILTFYFLGAILYAFHIKDYGLLPFHIMLFLGFASIFGASIYHFIITRMQPKK